MGRLHDRGPGPPADGLRDGAGPALPDPVRVGRGRHRLPARPRDRGGRPGRDDGRRRREVRGLADDLRALLGRRPLGGPVLRRARGERRLADHGHAVRSGSSAQPPIGRVYVPTSSYAEMGEWALPADERSCSPRSSTGRSRSTVPRRAGCAAGSGATSRSSTARSTTSTSRCCGRPRRSPRCRQGPGKVTRGRPPPSRPVQRLLLARPLRRHLHLAHAPRDVRAPDRRRGRWPTGPSGR